MRRRLGFTILISLVLHAMVLLPLFIATLQSAPPPTAHVNAAFEPGDRPEVPDPLERLGIDADTPSTMTWIGYEEFIEHLAPTAEVEQAAFTTSPPSAATPTATPAPETPPTPEIADPPPPAESDAERRRRLDAVLDALERAEDGADATPAPPPPGPEGAGTTPPAPVPPSPAPAPIAPPTPGDEPAPDPAPPTDTPPVPGDPSDKTTPATSRTSVPLDDIKLGKPLAASGLELKPQRPEFTTLTLLTASPGNPFVRISFGRDGKPKRATILRSSGDSRVDGALESSLYRWRASGAGLAELAEGKTIDVELKIILNARAR